MYSILHGLRLTVRSFVSAMVVVSIFAIVVLSRSVDATQSQVVPQGVYAIEQAHRGLTIYKDACESCHGSSLDGGSAPPLVGDDFVSVWEKRPLSEVFNKIRNTMPQNDPGKLKGEQVAEILAYILQSNKLPAGQAALSADEKVLEGIVWPSSAARPAKPAAVAPGAAPALPAVGNMAQLMRGLMFPASNLIFNAQITDPGEQRVGWEPTKSAFSWVDWGAGIYTGWEMIDNAAITISESAPLFLQPRRCENGKPAPVERPDWIRFTHELTEAGRTAFRASQSRNQEAIVEATNTLAQACLNCHEVYRDKPGGDPADPSNKAARCAP